MSGQTIADQKIAELARAEKSKLKKVMGFRDLVLFYIACIVTMRVVALSTENGPSVVVLWVLGFALFYVPQALTVVELTSRHPDEGGIYIWAKRAFGDFHGFITAWFYWATNLVYFPAVLLFSASNAAFVVPGWSYLAEDPRFLATFSLAGIVLVVVVNVLGLDIAKRLHNASGYLNMWVPGLIVMVLGFLAWLNFGAASEFSPSTVTPSFGGLSDVILLAAVAYGFTGLESASIMSEEVQDPRRNVPRALATAGLMMLAMFIFISSAMLVVLPVDQVSGLTGLTDTARVAGTKLIGTTVGGLLGSIVALCLCIAAIGTVSAWMATCARLPFVAGLDRYLPPAFGTLHPKYATPHVSIITLGVATAALIVLGNMGGTAQQIYRVFISLEIVVYFIPFIYMFGALLVMQRHPAADDIQRAPFAPYGAYFAGGAGLVVTVASFVFALIPGELVEDKTFFYVTVFGMLGVLTLIGVGIYANGRLRRRRIEAAPNPV
ncbi:MAG TPA: APC family permease [Acidobacteriota bacterium]|nr:APC family permease [Acidobacteriota bacterium]